MRVTDADQALVGDERSRGICVHDEVRRIRRVTVYVCECVSVHEREGETVILAAVLCVTHCAEAAMAAAMTYKRFYFFFSFFFCFCFIYLFFFIVGAATDAAQIVSLSVCV